MRHLSISRAWDEAKAILARDAGLFVAVGLALFVLPQTVAGLVTPATRPGQVPEPGWWTLISFVALLMSIAGQLAVVRLALPPSIRVADSIRRGASRLPVFILASLLFAIPVALALMLIAMPLLTGSGSLSSGNLLLLLLLVVLILPLLVRVLLTTAVVVAEEGGPIAVIKRSFDLTRGQAMKLAAFVLLFFIGFGIALGAYELVVGSAVKLFTSTDDPFSVGRLIRQLLSNIGATAVAVLFLIMVARLYAQLAVAEVGVPRSRG